MKIVHVLLSGAYNKNWGYQENLLTKYQKKLGHDVVIIASRFQSKIDKNYEFDVLQSGIDYDENGIKIIRINFFINRYISNFFRLYVGLVETLEKEKPDFIFIHSPQFLDSIKLVRYLKKNPNIIVAVDNHADFTNSATSNIARIFHLIFWKNCTLNLNSVTDVFFGVQPSRVSFLVDFYKVPENKAVYLPVGADDELIEKNLNSDIKNGKKEFIIITGGKIDESKLEVLELMKAVSNLENVKLIIFGSIIEKLKEEFEELITENIEFVGWKNQDEIYKLFLKSDLAFFPGRHSVMWEQVVAMGIPCIFKKLDNMEYLNHSDNCLFLESMKQGDYRRFIIDGLNSNLFNNLSENAKKDSRRQFMFSEIAKKSISIASDYHNRKRV